MAELKRTTDVNKHFHTILLREDNTGVCGLAGSGKKQHFHNVIWNDPIPPVIDFETQQELQPEQPGKFTLAEADGHTHDIVELIRVEQDTNTENDKACKMVHDLYKEAIEYEKDFRKEAKTDDEFYSLKQWPDDVVAELDAEQRSHLTIDETGAKLDTLSGTQRQTRYDIKYYARKGGSQVAAEVFTDMGKIICDWNNFDTQETEVFEDMMAVGRGIFDCYIDYENSINGDIKLRKAPWDGVVFGEHEAKDLDDLEYLIKHKWISKGQLKNEYPEKADDIERTYTGIFETTYDGEEVQPRVGTSYDKGNESNDLSDMYRKLKNDGDLVDVQRKNFKLLEMQRIVYKRVPVAVFRGEIDLNDPAGRPPMFNLNGYSQDEISQIKAMESVKIIKVPTSYIKKMVIAGMVKLDEENMKFTRFSCIPAYAKKRGKLVWGKVRVMRDPQQELNKRHSQAMDIINYAAGYGEFYDENTFPNKKEEANYKNNANNPRHIQKVKDINNLPQQKQGIKVPQEILTMESLSSDQLSRVSNIHPEMQGALQSQQSGTALLKSARQGLVGNEYLFDNLALARREVARWLLQAIAQVYTAKEIMEILYDYKEKNKSQEMASDAYSMEEIQDALTSALDGKLDKYDVKVSESASSPTKRYENFLKLLEAQRMGLEIPPEIIVEYLDLPLSIKEKAIGLIQERQAQEAEIEKMKAQTELQKSVLPALIAQQGRGADGQQAPGQMTLPG